MKSETDIDKIKGLEAQLDSKDKENKKLQETIMLDQYKIKNLENELESRDIEHKREIDIVEHDIESKNVKESWKVKEDHQKEIKDLQDKNFKDREEISDKYNERLDKAEHEKQDLKDYIEDLKQRLKSKE